MIDGPQPPRRWGLSELTPLAGGVSGATVLRGLRAGRPVVAKRTDHLEATVLTLLAELADPVFPTLREVSDDGDAVWLMIDFHDGRPAGITGDLGDVVHRAIGRLHGHFAGRVAELPDEAERVDRPFLLRLLTSFGPDQFAAARDVIDPELHRSGRALMDRLAADEDFLAQGRRLDATLLHGDLYGLNVLLPSRSTPTPLVIDWNVARVGPPMFDVAMTAPYDSAARRAHDQGWTEITGRPRDEAADRIAHAWCATMINIGYAGVVALRSSRSDGEQMIIDAIAHAEHWRTLRVPPTAP